MNTKEALEKKVWAVVGASPKKDKFGYKIFKKLQDHGYTVYPVNPGISEIEGTPAYGSLKEVPQVPEMVDFVVPEKVGIQTLEDCKELGITTVWLQPGADTDAVLQKAKELDIDAIQACVLVELKG